MRYWHIVVLGISMISIAGCSTLTGGDQKLPTGTRDPNAWKTPEGAMAMYWEAVRNFEGELCAGGQVGRPCLGQGAVNQTLGVVVASMSISGRITDELQATWLGASFAVYQAVPFPDYFDDPIDERQLSLTDLSLTDQAQSIAQLYSALHQARAKSLQGIGALEKYAPQAPVALRGHLYAIMGYAEILLADLFCSGVPLSTMDFEGDFTYHASSTTAQIYEHANALFDTAITLSGDSTRILNLAEIGKGRALLALGRYADAAAAVDTVETAFAAEFPIRMNNDIISQENKCTQSTGMSFDGATVSNREGGNGFPFVSSNDPRTAVIRTGTGCFGSPVYFPAKYAGPGRDTVLIYASGIEARLIEAENELHAGRVGEWLTLLNALRRSYAPTLPDIVDPEEPHARIDTMFAERAAWLFLTAHRLGDLRRLIRQYQRNQADVFPSGAYHGITLEFGPAVALPIPEEERINPHFTGCLSEGA